MMHRAEQILQAIENILTGLPTTGGNVVRGYADQLDAVPGLVIRMGEDALGESVSMIIDRWLDVDVVAHVRAANDSDSILNAIRAEVWGAIVADRSIGLPFVIDTTPGGDAAPTQRDNASPLVTQQMRWVVHYRHSISSAEA